MLWAVRKFHIVGPATNLDLVLGILQSAAFCAGDARTTFLAEEGTDFAATPSKTVAMLGHAAGNGSTGPGPAPATAGRPTRRPAPPAGHV